MISNDITTSASVKHQTQILGKYRIIKDVKRRGWVIILCFIPAFVWREWEKWRRTQSR